MKPDFFKKHSTTKHSIHDRVEKLYSEIERAVNEKEVLEVIVEINPKKRNEVYRAFRRIGNCIFYEFIPYVALKCEKRDAKKIADSVYKKNTDEKFERNFKYALENIVSLTLSNRVGIPPMKPGINYYFRKGQWNEKLWNLENIGAYEAMKISRGEKIKIGIIDTGVDYNHPEVSGRFGGEKGYDFICRNDKPLDRNGHGTHVAGITAGDYCGLARQSRLYSLRVLDEDGSGSEADVMLAIEWALKEKLDIANLSIGGLDASEAFKEVCYYAANNNLMIVAAAGNDGGFFYSYPASFEPVISVAAVDKENEHAYFSNINDMIDISAPGVDIISSYLNNSYRMLSGTSMAAPHVTGTLALALSINKDRIRVENLMKSCAKKLETPFDYDDSWFFGAGLIRADDTLNRLNNSSRLAKKLEAIGRKENGEKAIGKNSQKNMANHTEKSRPAMKSESAIKKAFDIIKKYW